MIVGYLIGFFIVVGSVSLISALLIGMGTRIFTKAPIPFPARFWVSAAAVVVSILIQKIMQGWLGTDDRSFWGALPGLSFFGVSWLLIVVRLGNNSESKSRNIVKGLLIALFQCLSLVLIMLVALCAMSAITHK